MEQAISEDIIPCSVFAAFAKTATLMPAWFIVVALAMLTCMTAGGAWGQVAGVAGDVKRQPSGASGAIVCDGRMGCAPLRPGCRLLRGGGSFDTVVICGNEKAGKRATQKSMRGSEN